MSTPEEFRVGADRLLCDDWHAHDRTVVLRPRDPGTPVRASTVTQVLEILAGRGIDRVLTAALDDADARAFTDAGFAVRETLCVLRHPLDVLPGNPDGFRLRRGSARRDLATAAAIDGRAFAGSDALDAAGVATVLAATGTTRFRFAAPPGENPWGYAIAGIAGGHGYIQRVAVEPERKRSGTGRALVGDALGWFGRHHAAAAFVNTQFDNHAARDLYASTGFVETGRRLTVADWNRPARP